jgi:hypothetical protein
VSIVQNINALFFMLEWAQGGLHKKRVGTRYIELVFLHPVRSVGQVCIPVRLGRKTSMHYFSSSVRPGAVFIKIAPGHVTPNLCFLHPVGSAGHVVHSSSSGARNVDALFFMHALARCYFHKKCTRARYAELVFFHLVKPLGHVVYSGVSGA